METSTSSTSKKRKTPSPPQPHPQIPPEQLQLHRLPPQIPPENLYIFPNVPPLDQLPDAYECTWRGHIPDILPDPSFNQGDADSCSYVAAVKACASTFAVANNEEVPLASCQILIDQMEEEYPDACLRRHPDEPGVVWSSRVVHSMRFLEEKGAGIDAAYKARVRIPTPQYPPTGRVLRIQGCDIYEVENYENEDDIEMGNIYEIPEGGGDIILNLIKKGPIAGEMKVYESSFRNYKKGIYEGRQPRELKEGNRLCNHAVLVVGFGRTRPGRDYFVIQNSHGRSHGIGGYCRVSRKLFWSFSVPLGPKIEVPGPQLNQSSAVSGQPSKKRKLFEGVQDSSSENSSSATNSSSEN